MTVEESAVPEGESPLTPPTDITEASEGADPKRQITQSLEGGMSEILQSEDAVDIMTSVLLNAAKIRMQAGKFGFERILIGTTTNIADIRKYTEQSLVELPFEVATAKIAKTGAGCAGIGLQKAWEEAFYWGIIQRYAATLDPMPAARGPLDGFTPQEKVATARFIEIVGVGTSDENQRKCRLWWKDLSDMQDAGVVCTLLYRNAEFSKYCKTFPRRKQSPRELIDTIVSCLWRCSASNSAVNVLPTSGGPLIQHVSRITTKQRPDIILQKNAKPLPFSFNDIVKGIGRHPLDMSFGKSSHSLLLLWGNVKVVQRCLFPVNLFDIGDSQLRYLPS
jgi:hypothetical protein